MVAGWRTKIGPWLGCGLVLVACGTDPPTSASSCVTVNVSPDCQPFYVPTFANVFQQTLRQKCATGMGTCHTSDAAHAGLIFENSDASYALLLGMGGGRKLVEPGDPSCSVVVARLQESDRTLRMPPGEGLIPAERCAIVKWISEGAKP